ncbi:MAG: hypothetical protein MPW15_06900 [Candidatus Manganitrophus sp.]|nr:hypothetical protein [Candidatus Manganitrophus sp.]
MSKRGIAQTEERSEESEDHAEEGEADCKAGDDPEGTMAIPPETEALRSGGRIGRMQGLRTVKAPATIDKIPRVQLIKFPSKLFCHPEQREGSL